MQLTCPYCTRVLEFSDDRPSFCAYCGHSLSTQKQAATAAYDRSADTPSMETGAETEIPELPDSVGGYRLVRQIGRGGMGTVHEAEEEVSGRRVAVKLISRQFATSEVTVDRFRQEGRLASIIAHPRCVFVLAADEDAGQPYIVMELMPGETLQDTVDQKGPRPPEEAVAKILDVIEGLQEAHRLGVVHRDVKPSNCFLEANGRVKIGDFGLSKSLVQNTRLTRTGSFVGTPLYASPEQIRADGVDEQSDVYSVAATLYFLLTGRAPHQTSDAAATLARIVSEPAPSMRIFRPELSAALDEVVLRGLERQRERRWRDLAELREALLPFVPGQIAIGGLGMRLGAYLIDFLCLSLLEVALVFVILAATNDMRMQVWLATPLYAVLMIGYFTILEGVGGCSLGKRLLGLRVRTTAGNASPGLGRAWVRAGSLYLLFNLGSVIALLLFLPYLPSDQRDLKDFREDHFFVFLVSSTLPVGWRLLGLVLTLLPMRARNGYRGLHEFASGTCVLDVPCTRKRRLFGNRTAGRDVSRPDGLPESVGPFVVQGAYHFTPSEKLLLGEDQALGRKVWIWMRPLCDPPLSTTRRKIGRMSRPWCLASGVQDEMQWDAFVAPAGCPLPKLISDEGKLSWPDVRPILEELTEELVHASKEGTLPERLTVDQVWIEPNGRVQLVDAPLCSPGDYPSANGQATAASEANDFAGDASAISLLAEVAIQALEKKPRAVADRKPPLKAPAPRHATRLLNRLLLGRDHYEELDEVQADLRQTREQPPEVTRARRAGQMAALIAFLTLGLAFMGIAGWGTSYLNTVGAFMHVKIAERYTEMYQLDAGFEAMTAVLQPEPLPRIRSIVEIEEDLRGCDRLENVLEDDRRAYEARRQALSPLLRPYMVMVEETVDNQMQAAPVDFSMEASITRQRREEVFDQAERRIFTTVFTAVALGMIVFWPAVWVCGTFLLRGGVSLRVLGLALVNSHGQPAGRLRCAWRAFLIWAPVTALLAGSVLLEEWYWNGWSQADPNRWAWWMSGGLWWAALALLLSYVVHALWFPIRGLHDWLSGTYLVPE